MAFISRNIKCKTFFSNFNRIYHEFGLTGRINHPVPTTKAARCCIIRRRTMRPTGIEGGQHTLNKTHPDVRIPKFAQYYSRCEGCRMNVQAPFVTRCPATEGVSYPCYCSLTCCHGSLRRVFVNPLPGEYGIRGCRSEKSPDRQSPEPAPRTPHRA